MRHHLDHCPRNRLETNVLPRVSIMQEKGDWRWEGLQVWKLRQVLRRCRANIQLFVQGARLQRLHDLRLSWWGRREYPENESQRLLYHPWRPWSRQSPHYERELAEHEADPTMQGGPVGLLLGWKWRAKDPLQCYQSGGGLVYDAEHQQFLAAEAWTI